MQRPIKAVSAVVFLSPFPPPRKYNQLEILQQKSSPPPQPEIIIRVPHRNNTRSRRSVRPTHTRPVTFSVCGLSIIPLKRQSNTLPACIAFEPSIIAGRMRTRVNAQLAQLQSTVAIFIRLQGGGGTGTRHMCIGAVPTRLPLASMHF